MNLNADAGEDITFDHLFTEKSDQLDLVDHTDQINPNQPNKETTVIVNTDNQSDPVRPSANELFGSPLIKNELPNFNAEFIDVTKNNYNRTTDLIEVYNGLIQANGVSKEDISLVDSISPGFINDKNPIGFYTEERSKTQYKKTLESLDKEIDARIGIIAQASIDYLDKAHEKYSVLIPALQESVIDKIMSLQLEIQQLSLKVNKEDKSINDVLESIVGRYITNDCDKYSDLPSGPAKALVELAGVFGPGHSFAYKLDALYSSQLNTENDTWFTIGDSRQLFSIHKEAPYISVCPAKDHHVDDSVQSLHIHTTLATGAAILDQIKTLCGAAIGVISGFPKYKEDIKSISSSVDKPKNVILDELYCISSGSAKDALVVLNIVNFLESFICYLDKLKNVYSAISSNQTNVATEGLIDKELSNLCINLESIEVSSNKVKEKINKFIETIKKIIAKIINIIKDKFIKIKILFNENFIKEHTRLIEKLKAVNDFGNSEPFKVKTEDIGTINSNYYDYLAIMREDGKISFDTMTEGYKDFYSNLKVVQEYAYDLTELVKNRINTSLRTNNLDNFINEISTLTNNTYSKVHGKEYTKLDFDDSRQKIHEGKKLTHRLYIGKTYLVKDDVNLSSTENKNLSVMVIDYDQTHESNILNIEYMSKTQCLDLLNNAFNINKIKNLLSIIERTGLYSLKNIENAVTDLEKMSESDSETLVDLTNICKSLLFYLNSNINAVQELTLRVPRKLFTFIEDSIKHNSVKETT